MHAIEVRELRKVYGGVAVVDGVSFDIEAGEVFALLGPNGAGKTTTVEILEGHREADGGTATVLGHDPRRLSGRIASASASCCRRPGSRRTSRSSSS
nr:ATP-binding cassette domain-containing protein [Agromyces tardus]